MHRLRHLILLSLALLASVALAACGGDDGGGENDEDPQQVLRQTFENNQQIKSGTFEFSLSGDSEGGDQAGSFELTLGGPFQSSDDGGLPQFDVDGELTADSAQGDFNFSGGLAATGNTAYVNVQGTEYEVPQELFDQFASTFARLQAQSEQQADAGNFLKQLGIDPTNWLSELSNEGTEDVEGTETIHVSGTADVPKLLEDVQRIAEKAGGQAAQQLTPEQLAIAEDTIESAEFDVYSGVDDHLLRKLSANLELVPPEGTPGAPESVTLDFSLSFGAVNQPQTITAPQGAKPLAELLQQYGIDQGQLEGALRGGLGGLPQAGGSTAAPSTGATEAYSQCLQTANSAEAIQACAELLQ